MAASDRDRFDGSLNPLLGPRRAKATMPGTFGSGSRFGNQPEATDSKQRLALTAPGPLVAGRSGPTYVDLASNRSGLTPRSKTPGVPRSAISHAVSERRAMTPPSRPAAKALMAGATKAQVKRSPIDAGPIANRQAAPPPSRPLPSATSAYPGTRPRTPTSVAYPQPSARSRAGQLSTSRPATSIRSTPTRSVSRPAASRRLDFNDTPPTVRTPSIPRGGVSHLSTARPSELQLPSNRSALQGRLPQFITGAGAPSFRDPDDDWLGTYERTSAGLFQELEGILGGLTRLGHIAPIPVEARAPPLQLPPASDSSSGGRQRAGAAGRQQQPSSTQAISQAGPGVGMVRPGGLRAADSGISSAAAPLMASPVASAVDATRSQFQCDMPGGLTPIESSLASDRLGSVPSLAADYTAAAGPDGGADRVTPPVSLPAGALGDLWNVLQARNRQTAKLMADLAAARREAQVANERAEEADGLARAFQQQLIARQQHVASWQAALVEMEEREDAAKQQLLGARERCEELTRRAQQAEHVAATAQIRLERIIAQREAQLAAGSQAGAQQQRGADAEQEAQSKEAAETLRLQLQQLQADLAAAQTRATRAELELAVARNKALLAKQELASEEDRARRATATAAVMRQELGRTQSALESIGREHDRLQHQLHDTQVLSPQASQPASATQPGAQQRPNVISATPRQPLPPEPGATRQRAVHSAPNPAATSATGSQPPGPQPGPQATASEGQEPLKAGRISDVIDQDLKDSDDSGARTAYPSHSGETAAAAPTLNPAPAPPPVYQRSGSLLLLPPGEVPLDRSASLRYGQHHQHQRHRRSRSHDFDAIETIGEPPRAGTAISPNMEDLARAGGPLGGHHPRKQSRLGGPAGAYGRLSFDHDGTNRRLRARQDSSDSSSEGDGLPRGLGARPYRGPPSTSDTGEEGGTSHVAAAALKALLADSIPADGGINHTLKRGPFLNEMLPLSRTPSSGARRRPSGFRVSQTSGLRGVMPGCGTGSGALGLSPLQGTGGAGGGTAAGSLSSRSSLTAGSATSDMIKIRKLSGSEGSGAGRCMPTGGGSGSLMSRAADAPVAGGTACETRSAGKAVESSQGFTETESERARRKPGSVTVSLADLRRQMRASETQSTRGTPHQPASPASSTRTPPPAANTPSRTADGTIAPPLQHQQQRKGEVTEQQPMQGIAHSVPGEPLHGGAVWHPGAPGPQAQPLVTRSRVPASALTTDSMLGVHPTSHGPDAGARTLSPYGMPAMGSAYPSGGNPRGAPFFASARAAMANPTQPNRSGPSSPVIMAPALGALPAGVDWGLPQGYHTSHLNDLYESRASRWPSPISTPQPSNDGGPGHGIPLLYESPRALGPRGSDSEGGAGQTPPRSRFLAFTSRSRMLSPAQVESYRVAPSLTASIALASPSSSTSLGTFTMQIPRAQAGPVPQFAAFPVAARLMSPPRNRDQAGLLPYNHEWRNNANLEKQPSAPIGLPITEVDVTGDMPLLHSSHPHSEGQVPAGPRSAHAPQPRRPWWQRLLPWRRPGSQGANPESPDCITSGHNEASSTSTSKSDVPTQDEPMPCDTAAVSARSVCVTVCVADVEASKSRRKGSAASRRPRRGGDGGRRILHSLLFHLGTWAGGVALGVVLVWGLAGMVEGALDAGDTGTERRALAATSGRGCGCAEGIGGMEEGRAGAHGAGICVEVCDSPSCSPR